jgi:predicted enzyme related to lactoylglutathione lyase
MVEGVSVVWVPAQDTSRAVSFYRDTLGLGVQQHDEGWAEVDAGQIKIGINGQEPQGTGEQGGPVIAFQPTGGLDEAVSRLKEKGVDVPGDISEHPWGRIATFKDSEGNDLQFYEPPSS